MKKSNRSDKVVLAAIASITILDGIALLMGIDGVLFMTSLAAVAGLAGYVLPQPNMAKS